MIIDPTGIRKPTLSELQRLNGLWRKHPRYLGCVGHWLMAEGGGSKVYDTSGYGSHGSLVVASQMWINGKFGTTLNFTQSASEYVNLGTVAGNFGTSDFTILVWGKRISESDAGNGLVAKYGTAPGWGFHISSALADKLRFSIWADKGTHTYVNGNTAVDDNLDHLFVVVVDRQTGTESAFFYLDGRPDGGTSDNIAAQTGSVNNTLGCYIGFQNFQSYHDGPIDQVRFYNRALSAVEIQSLYYDPFLEFRRTRKYYFIQQAPGTPALTIEAVN